MEFYGKLLRKALTLKSQSSIDILVKQKGQQISHKVQIKLVPTYTLSDILLIACRYCWQKVNT